MKYVIIIAFFCYTKSLAQNMERVLHVIDSLCSSQMHGRGYTHAGDKKAAKFIASHFQKAGLLPFQKNYFQEFPITVNTFARPMRLKIGKQLLREGIDYLPHPACPAGKGKFVLLIKDSLVLYHPKGEIWLTDKLVHRLEDEQNDAPRFIIRKDIFWEAVQKSKKFSFKIQPKLQKDYITQNVIGYVRGKEVPDSFLVFTAHYDHLGDLGKVYFAGANDNASGVAMLLELAYYFAQNPMRYSVAFMAFGAEEIGLLGSLFYTENPYFPLQNIRFLLNLDLFGTGEGGTTAVNGLVFTEEFQLLHHINNEYNYLTYIGARGKAPNSDHYYFSEKGVKSFFLYLQGDSWKHYHHIDDKPPLPLSGFQSAFQLIKTFAQRLGD
ncbi:MAG: M28 family peptidase [Cytophagales bacterium]|nr:M28 family peptidase [Cytophagales bacterium]MDW8384800.1 M28 family peptidase [Flammeovirgaceae bacterium]